MLDFILGDKRLFSCFWIKDLFVCRNRIRTIFSEHAMPDIDDFESDTLEDVRPDVREAVREFKLRLELLHEKRRAELGKISDDELRYSYETLAGIR